LQGRNVALVQLKELWNWCTAGNAITARMLPQIIQDDDDEDHTDGEENSDDEEEEKQDEQLLADSEQQRLLASFSRRCSLQYIFALMTV